MSRRESIEADLGEMNLVLRTAGTNAREAIVDGRDGRDGKEVQWVVEVLLSTFVLA